MRRAFTLIEVMVVLSILAIIAILTYSFFGSVVKEAKLKHEVAVIEKSLLELQAAYDLYIMKNPNAAVGTGNVESLAFTSELKTIPPFGATEYWSNAVVADPEYALYCSDWDSQGACDDYIVYRSWASNEACNLLNEKYAPEHSASPPGSVALVDGVPGVDHYIACYVSGGKLNPFIVVGVH